MHKLMYPFPKCSGAPKFALAYLPRGSVAFPLVFHSTGNPDSSDYRFHSAISDGSG